MNNNQQPQGVQRNFTPINTSGSGNQRWEPQKWPSFDPNNPPSIEGYFIKHSPFTGQNGGFFVSEIATVNPDGSIGEHLDFSGGHVATNALGEVTLGSYIRIEYHGKKGSKQGGRTYNDFKISVDYSVVPYSPMMEPNRQSAPQANGYQQSAQPQGQQQGYGQQQRQALPNQQQPVNTGHGQWNGQQNGQHQAPPQGHGYQQQNAPAYNAPPAGQQNSYQAPPTFNNQAPAQNQQATNQQPFNPQAAVKSQPGPQSTYVPAGGQMQGQNMGSQNQQQPVNTGHGQWNGQNYNGNDDLPF